ncbi:MAG: rhomboid family intramembrane serine protease [Cytophagales bacterium]|nr:rhomboid family intramembrane serine protease [Cytophagales bacterium]
MTVTLFIIIVTSALSFYAWQRGDIMQKWLLTPYRIHRHNEFYRFLTSGLIHANFTHLLFNMLTLYFFGELVEIIYRYYFGNKSSLFFVLLYGGGIVLSGVPTYLKHKQHAHYHSLGASGGVAAVIFSSILFHPLSYICLFAFICLPGFIMGGLYLLYSYYFSTKQADHINHDAHLWGAIYGAIFSIILHPKVVIYFFYQVVNFVKG